MTLSCGNLIRLASSNNKVPPKLFLCDRGTPQGPWWRMHPRGSATSTAGLPNLFNVPASASGSSPGSPTSWLTGGEDVVGTKSCPPLRQKTTREQQPRHAASECFRMGPSPLSAADSAGLPGGRARCTNARPASAGHNVVHHSATHTAAARTRRGDQNIVRMREPPADSPVVLRAPAECPNRCLAW